MSKIKTLEEICKKISTGQKNGAYTLRYFVQEGENLPPIKRIWGNYIFENSLIHFPSIRGSAKSLLMYQICMAVSANRKEFLGEAIELNGKTAFLDFEMPHSFIKRRSAKLFKNRPFELKGYLNEMLVYSTRQSFEAAYDTIIQLITQEKPVLVVIDNLRTALKNANTNSAIDMANFFSVLGSIRELYNCAIVIIDHVRKGTRNQKTDSDTQSGSGAKTDLSDGDFQIRHSCQDKQLRLIKRLKSRMFEEADETKLVRLNPETLWFELVEMDCSEAEHIGLSTIEEKDELLDIAKDLHLQGKSYQEIATALSKPKSTIYRWLEPKKPKS